MMESYRALEAKLREGAAARHETAHRLTALDALYQTGDWAGLGRLLEELGEQNARLSRTAFSPNFAVNAILQDAETRARAAGIRLEVRADVPEQLPVPVEDLCALLMNLLDNALEGAARVEVPGERFIRFRAAAKDGYFAVRCENSYAGPLAPDERGRLRTTKADPEAHGFGLPQMSAVAQSAGRELHRPGVHRPDRPEAARRPGERVSQTEKEKRARPGTKPFRGGPLSCARVTDSDSG